MMEGWRMMLRPQIRVVAALVVLATALGACGGDGGADRAGASPTTTTSTRWRPSGTAPRHPDPVIGPQHVHHGADPAGVLLLPARVARPGVGASVAWVALASSGWRSWSVSTAGAL